MVSNRLVLDTHVFKWTLEGNLRMNLVARTAIETAETKLLLPSLCLLEFYSIIDRNRTRITREQLTAVINNERRFRIVPLTYRIAFTASTLTMIKSIHDRIIVATTIETDRRFGNAALLTADIEINRSKVCPVLWAGDEKYA